ncbi:cell wall hydrolase [Sphingomonas sp. CJ99]
MNGRSPAHDDPLIRRRPAMLALLALALILVPALLVALTRHGSVASPSTAAAANGNVVPPTVLPQVEPVVLRPVEVADAVRINAAIPFSTAPNPAAAPFAFAGSDADRERAIACLAAAVLYEAGEDLEAQQSVAQVVLNRVRHPAFPDTVCGVVFQGSERSTGCQFTFTCDGALQRRYSDGLWAQAREVAAMAINGFVYAPVGHATHYHTNWVVPYWSSSLDKIVEVKTHLFFRWTGWWGTPRAFTDRATGIEPIYRELASYSPLHAPISADLSLPGDEALAGGVVAAMAESSLPRAVEAERNSFITAIDPSVPADELPLLAARACGSRAYCKFLGWTDAAKVPAGGTGSLPLDSPALRTMSFSYLRDRGRRFEKALWNCDEFPRSAPQECMQRRVVRAGARPAPAPPADGPASPQPQPGIAPDG